MANFTYLCTYGVHCFLSDEVYVGRHMRVHEVLSDVMNRAHPRIESENGHAGSSRSIMFNTFLSHAAQLRITCHADDALDFGDARVLTLQDVVYPLAAHGYKALRFHLHVDETYRGSTDYRGRLARFFAHYNPTLLLVVDQMLAEAGGFEEELLSAFVARYGPEPGPAVDARFRDRLLAFYHCYNSSKVPEVDEILIEYGGNEEQLFGALIAKYGPEPVVQGSDLASDDTYTFVTPSEEDQYDPYPLPVPLMPFTQPAPVDASKPGFEPEHDPQRGCDPNFWDNFVNQMPDDGENAYGGGVHCNQDTLRMYMHAFPTMFPCRVTLTCPHKGEEVFRSTKYFWEYVKLRSESNQREVGEAVAAGGKHVVNCTADEDPTPVWLTRREWQQLVADWEDAHGIQRRVRIGSVAMVEDAPAPVVAAPSHAELAERHPPMAEMSCQTVAAVETQTEDKVAQQEPPRTVDQAIGTDPPVAWVPTGAIPPPASSTFRRLPPPKPARKRTRVDLPPVSPTRGAADLEPCLVAALQDIHASEQGGRGHSVQRSVGTLSEGETPPPDMDSVGWASHSSKPPPSSSRATVPLPSPSPRSDLMPESLASWGRNRRGRRTRGAAKLHAAFAEAEARLAAQPTAMRDFGHAPPRAPSSRMMAGISPPRPRSSASRSRGPASDAALWGTLLDGLQRSNS